MLFSLLIKNQKRPQAVLRPEHTSGFLQSRIKMEREYILFPDAAPSALVETQKNFTAQNRETKSASSVDTVRPKKNIVPVPAEKLPGCHVSDLSFPAVRGKASQ